MTLKKTNATLEELIGHRDSLRVQIRDLQKQEKTVKDTIKAIEKFTAQIPAEPRSRAKKRAAAASA